MKRKAFTLVELLVVIAIIAILASILFPVFLQTELAAQKISTLSNGHQLALASEMYLDDYDQLYPIGNQGTTWKGMDLWCQRLLPYVKDVAAFGSPSDSFADEPSIGVEGHDYGVGISFAVNGYYVPTCCKPTWDTSFELHGPMGEGNEAYPGGHDDGYGWLEGESLHEEQITQPAATILFAQKQGDDINRFVKQYGDNDIRTRGNWSDYGKQGVLYGEAISSGLDPGWGPKAIPNGSTGFWKTHGIGSPFEFEFGVNGAVSAPYAGEGVFCFVDGHAKAMVPYTTNPDPDRRPQDNLWDALR